MCTRQTTLTTMRLSSSLVAANQQQQQQQQQQPAGEQLVVLAGSASFSVFELRNQYFLLVETPSVSDFRGHTMASNSSSYDDYYRMRS
jgi:hypothetical protein